MRVEKSSKSQVAEKLAALAEGKRRASEAAVSLQENNPAVEDDSNEFEDAVRRKDEEALRRKAERERRREERKQKEHEEQEVEEEGLSGGLDPAMAEMMGFSGFGGSKKN